MRYHEFLFPEACVAFPEPESVDGVSAAADLLCAGADAGLSGVSEFLKNGYGMPKTADMSRPGLRYPSTTVSRPEGFSNVYSPKNRSMAARCSKIESCIASYANQDEVPVKQYT